MRWWWLLDERVILRSLSRCSWYVDCIPGWTVIVFDLLLHVPVVDPPIPVQYPLEYSSSINDSRKSLAGKPNLDGWLFQGSYPLHQFSNKPQCFLLLLLHLKKSLHDPVKSLRQERRTLIYIPKNIDRLGLCPTFLNPSWCCCNGSTHPDVALIGRSRGPAHLLLIPPESKAPNLEKLLCLSNSQTLHVSHWFPFL